MIKIGIIADDFTGAGDAASFLKLENANCILINGIPEENFKINESIDVVIIALKTRSIAHQIAITEVNQAYDFLNKIGVEVIYSKYGSTFDSTADGNIGPVLDNLLEKMDLTYTLISPALPVNNRKVENGILYVDGLPIEETHMKLHPLNPMDESDLVVLMERQSKYKVFTLTVPQMENFLLDKISFDKYIQEKSEENGRFYLAVDYFEDNHGKIIAELFQGLKLFSGSSALPPFIYQMLTSSSDSGTSNYSTIGELNQIKGGVLAGSLSKATQCQIANFLLEGYASYEMSGQLLLSSFEVVKEEVIHFIDGHIEDVFIIYSEKGKDVAPTIHNEIGSLVEKMLSFAGEYMIEKGITNLVVAGGETSGAVVKTINPNSFYIGEVISPGVPILIPDTYQNLKIVLKSGNFGEEDFFIRALKIMK